MRVDFDSARSVKRDFYDQKRDRAGIQKDDILINSTGDGTIGRVAVFNRSFPVLVDGHVSIVRLRDKDLAWYVAAYLLSDQGQKQIYRYINGSSGQVEIYPQDLSRLWIPGAPVKNRKAVADKFRLACSKHDEFSIDLKIALAML